MTTAVVPHGTEWIELDETDSTNAEAMRRAIAGARGPAYILAERQLAGKGRSGRAWHSPPANLALSRLGQVHCRAEQVSQLSLVAGIAVHEAVSSVLNEPGDRERLCLKWPNDLLLDGVKLAGILVEATAIGDVLLAVIGIGVNMAHAPEIPGRRTAALAPVARVASAKDFARLVAGALETALTSWDEGRGFAVIRQDWLSRTMAIDTPMTISTAQAVVAGRFQGLGEDGGLLMRDQNGVVRKYCYGDVSLASGPGNVLSQPIERLAGRGREDDSGGKYEKAAGGALATETNS